MSSKSLKFIQFAVITEVEGNVNADESVGTRITIKKFVTKEGIYPYVSSRAIKKGIKLALEREGFKIDPYEKEYSEGGKKQKGDSGNFIEYIDQDLFGYMIPENPPKKRKAPVEISYLTSVFPIPVTVEFAGRFPKKDNPIPFEIEQAKFLGRFYGIIYNYIGVIAKEEVSNKIKIEEYKDKIEDKGNYYIVKNRKERLKALLNILLSGSFTLPRATNQLNYGNYKYVIIALTNSIKPLPTFVTVKYQKEREYEIIKEERDGKTIEKVIEKSSEGYKLDIEKLKEFKNMLEENEKLYIIDFVGDIKDEELIVKKPLEINEIIKEIINNIDLENFDYYLRYYE